MKVFESADKCLDNDSDKDESDDSATKVDKANGVSEVWKMKDSHDAFGKIGGLRDVIDGMITANNN